MHSFLSSTNRWALLGLIVALATFATPDVAFADPTTTTLPGTGPLSPQSDAAVQKLTLILSNIHDAPSEAALRALEPSVDVPTTMQRLIEDPNANGIVRSNAIYSLRLYSSEETRRFAAALLQAQVERNSDDERHHMGRTVRLIGQYLSADDPAWAIDTLTSIVDHPDFGIREEVVAGLLVIRTYDTMRPRVDDILLQRVLAERNPAVRKRLRNGLQGVKTLTPSSVPAPIHRSTP